eukprot:210118-Amphidinium_carterae.1
MSIATDCNDVGYSVLSSHSKAGLHLLTVWDSLAGKQLTFSHTLEHVCPFPQKDHDTVQIDC